MNSNFKLFKSSQYLNEHIHDIIKDNYFPINPNINKRLLYASFLINSVLYDSKIFKSNIDNSFVSETTPTINTLQKEENNLTTKNSDWYNSEYPKLTPPKKRWLTGFDAVQ
jgi:hypothetical protein